MNDPNTKSTYTYYVSDVDFLMFLYQKCSETQYKPIIDRMIDDWLNLAIERSIGCKKTGLVNDFIQVLANKAIEHPDLGGAFVEQILSKAEDEYDQEAHTQRFDAWLEEKPYGNASNRAFLMLRDSEHQESHIFFIINPLPKPFLAPPNVLIHHIESPIVI